MTWQQLKEILDENQKIVEEEKTKSITQCPECGFNELRENKEEDLLCPICGWTGRR